MAQSKSFTFNGLIGNKINIVYKQVDSNSINKTIIEDEDFDISKSKIINYKGASLEIIKATNQYLLLCSATFSTSTSTASVRPVSSRSVSTFKCEASGVIQAI